MAPMALRRALRAEVRPQAAADAVLERFLQVIRNNKGLVDGFVPELTFAKQLET